MAARLETILILAATRNFHETERIFNDRFPNRISEYLRKLVFKFTTVSSLQNKKPPGHSSVSGEKLRHLRKCQ